MQHLKKRSDEITSGRKGAAMFALYLNTPERGENSILNPMALHPMLLLRTFAGTQRRSVRVSVMFQWSHTKLHL